MLVRKRILLWGGEVVENEVDTLSKLAQICKIMVEGKSNLLIELYGDLSIEKSLQLAKDRPPDLHFVLLNNIRTMSDVFETLYSNAAEKWKYYLLNEQEMKFAGFLSIIQKTAQRPMFVFSGLELTTQFEKTVSENWSDICTLWPIPPKMENLAECVLVKLDERLHRKEHNYQCQDDSVYVDLELEQNRKDVIFPFLTNHFTNKHIPDQLSVALNRHQNDLPQKDSAPVAASNEIPKKEETIEWQLQNMKRTAFVEQNEEESPIEIPPNTPLILEGEKQTLPGTSLTVAQKYILICTMAVILLMGLFPPFYFKLPNGLTFNLGYGFIGFPPLALEKFSGLVNYRQLMVQWIGIVLIAGIGCFICKQKH